MGVHGLWELLSPVGRRVSVETLAGKRLAIDASIWMVQFMKAMRDERGEMVRNAHLLGFFRRICKLLFLRTKPVFVFDGATPDLKRRTVAARRRHRDSAQAKVRKTAEKLLLNHLKAMRLQELADNIKNQRQKQKSGVKGKKVLANPSSLAGSESGKNYVSSVNCNQEKLDEMLAASIAEEEEEGLANNLAAADAIHCDEDDDEDEEMILPDMIGEVDPAVLAALTPSLQLDLLQKQKRDNDAKGKKIQSINTGSNIEMGETVLSSSNQQKLDEMLAASLMEEEKRAFSNNASTSTAPYPVEDDVNMDEDEDEDEDGEEEMIVPPMDGEVDPSILASLPPSMQLDLLVQIRERLMADNRQKYQKVKKDPEKFSELQIQAYLKTVAFRREIDQVQKAASGRGVGGVQTSRIASEANREFIFSSSFTGNKQVLASGRAEECRDKQQVSEKRSSTAMPTVTSTAKLKTVTGSEERSSSVMHAAASTSKSKTVTGSEEQASRIVRTATSTSKSKTVTESELNGSRRVFDDSIETYVDEQGRVRVSRVRAMGIRMTRDLQRNLDMMKEIEQERENVNRPQSESNSALPTTFPGNPIVGTSPEVAELVKLNNADENSAINGDTSIEISFGDDGDIKCFDGDDDIFTRLVSENPGRVTSDNITPLVNLSSASDSDCDWEEGTTEANGNTLSDDANLSTKPLISEVNDSDGSEVEWEEGFREDSEHTASPVAEKRKLNSKGYLEEEADLQEAIRRSLGDKVDTKSDYVLTESDRLELPGRNACEISGFPDSKHRTEGPMFQVDDDVQQNISTCEILDGVGGGFSKTADSLGMPSKQSIVSNPDDPTPCVSSPKQLMEGGSKSASLLKELPHTESLSTSEVKEVVADGGQNTVSAPEPTFCPLVNTTNPILPFSQEEMNELIDDIDKEEKLAAKHCENTCFQEVEHGLDNSALEKDEDWHVETTEANLEEELKILDKERLNLGDERRRLERNAESVSGEMFIECQELLQMFGIPYIISPTEAEAQCAYMEIANLVDGVVTDDSDAFLFGAQSVYKNIFDDRKYVETYFMKDIENELGLTREKLISMALLLGSDYTEGISGIGIVNATEVLNAFPEEGGLKEFRGWIESPDPTILGKLDDQSDSKARKKGSSRTGNNESCSQSNITGVSVLHENSSEDQEQKQSADDIQDRKKIFMDKHRKVSKNWHVPASFPSATVISAYLSPEIDKSTEPFSWGKPDHFLLRKLCWEKFSWDSQKADELILPVLKEYNKRETQLRLEAFYTFNERFAKFRSKRIKKAVKGITGKKSLQLDDYVPKDSGSKNKRKSRQTETGDDQSENVPQGSEENVFSNQTDLEKKSTTRKPRKRTKLGTGVVSESPALSDDVEGASKRSQPSGRSRGRGRGRGSGRGKGKGSPTCEVSETSSSDDAKEVHVKTQKEPVELRRSRRARKPVEYMANDSETDDPNHSVDEKDKEYFVKEASDMSEFPASGLGQDQERNFAENVSPEQGFETDYLEKGGGFCLEEGDNNDGLTEPKEYLRTGGGFCVDEDRTRPEENSTHDRATLEAEENANLDEKETDVSEPTTDPLSARTMDQSKSRASLPENDTNCSLTIPVGALRPMPHLRKKRRKG